MIAPARGKKVTAVKIGRPTRFMKRSSPHQEYDDDYGAQDDAEGVTLYIACLDPA
jgi:hypothetical protein